MKIRSGFSPSAFFTPSIPFTASIAYPENRTSEPEMTRNRDFAARVPISVISDAGYFSALADKQSRIVDWLTA